MDIIDRKEKLLKQLYRLNDEAILTKAEQLPKNDKFRGIISNSESDFAKEKVVDLADFEENMTKWIKRQYTK